MYNSNNNNYLGQLWMRDIKDNVYPLNEALSAVFLKYKKPEPTFYNDLTSNRIKTFDTFYDSIFIQTKTGYLFDKYITNENFEILPYDRINNFNANKTSQSIDYWFDELEQKVYFFEFVDPTYTPPVVEYSAISYAFNFKCFDIKTNIISNLISKRIYFWLHKPIDLYISNGFIGNPKLSYNTDTKTFNVSFIVKNDVASSFGMISMNFNKEEVDEVNTWIPFGEVMPFGYEPIDDNNNIPYFNCSEEPIDGTRGFNQFYIGLGSLTGTAGIRYNAFNIPDKFDIIWNGNFYSTGYVGSNSYNSDLVEAGIPLSAIKTGPGTGLGQLTFTKNFAYPNYALIRVSAPLEGTGWSVSPICVYTPQPTPTPTPTKTPNYTPPPPSPTRTPTQTRTPSPTPPAPASFKSIYIAFE